MLSCLKFLKAGILRTLYPIPLDFLTAYKFRLVVDKKLIKKWKLVCYLSQSHELLMPVSTIKIKEKSTPEPIILAFLLLFFKEVKGLNAKMLCNLFLFGGKVSEVQKEDSESDKSMSLEDDFITSSPQKHKAEKASKKSLKKKLKIRPAEPLASSGTNRQKGKAAIITKTDREVIVGKA